MDNLKPCPFCGGQAFLAHDAKRKVYGKDEYRTGTAVYCGVCEARMFYSNPKLAAEAWNRRANDGCGARKMIEEAPPVDVRPVVFCKDCVHFTAFSVINTDGTGKCGLREKCSIDCLVDEYDFCSSGERREGGTP